MSVCEVVNGELDLRKMFIIKMIFWLEGRGVGLVEIILGLLEDRVFEREIVIIVILMFK